MTRTAYIEKRFHRKSLDLIDKSNVILADLRQQGYSITLRQLYYQLVSQDIIPNNQKSYDNLGNVISDARLAGYMDLEAIEDRTRNLQSLAHWDDPSDIIESAASSYRVDKWEHQPYRIECWIEKEALANVVARACIKHDISYIACRGYMSTSEMWAAAQRLGNYADQGQTPIILHLGDHDPSGMHMTIDIEERMNLFLRHDFGITIDVRRLALNMDQVRQYKPAPNPAKMSDSKAIEYVRKYGTMSWELDALQPAVINQLIEDEILSLRDDDLWEDVTREERKDKDTLIRISQRYTEIAERYS